MRKQTKLAVGVSAAALLAIGASMTSFAANRGWTNEGDAWYYYDNSGDYVTDKWKSYNGNYFYLGEEGYMLTNELIEDGENYYYVDANGAMVKNTWVAIAADDDETEDVDYRWYYFGPSGKAYKDSKGKTINGKKYGFDADGKMLFGFADESGLINDTDDAILSCVYYYGTNDDGARHSGWLRYEDGFSEHEEYDDDYYWFWFASNGKKRTTNKKINGKNYSFDANGVMVTEFRTGTNSEITSIASGSKYYSDNLEDGSLKKSAWIRTSMPDEWSTALGTAWDDDDHWFRTDSQGYLLTNQTKKINSKWYAFDANGVMQDGLVVLDNGANGQKVSGSTFAESIDEDNTTADDIYALSVGKNDPQGLYYFSADEEKDGSMKTGSSIKISLADDDYKFYFTKTTGQAFDGIKNNKIYINGILQEANDDKYVKVSYDGKDYLIGSSGTIAKAGHYYKDANETYWVVKKDAAGDFVITECADVDAAKAALK